MMINGSVRRRRLRLIIECHIGVNAGDRSKIYIHWHENNEDDENIK